MLPAVNAVVAILLLPSYSLPAYPLPAYPLPAYPLPAYCCHPAAASLLLPAYCCHPAAASLFAAILLLPAY